MRCTTLRSEQTTSWHSWNNLVVRRCDDYPLSRLAKQTLCLAGQNRNMPWKQPRVQQSSDFEVGHLKYQYEVPAEAICTGAILAKDFVRTGSSARPCFHTSLCSYWPLSLPEKPRRDETIVDCRTVVYPLRPAHFTSDLSRPEKKNQKLGRRGDQKYGH
jgi:hypothetical protein